MKNISKKVLLSILSLVITFVALGATTFAWFSLGTTATVDQFNVNVTGAEGLEISLGTTGEWYTTVNQSVLRDYIQNLVSSVPNSEINDDGEFVMGAVTTLNGEDFFLFGTEVDVDGVTYLTHLTTDAATKNKDYLSLNFKLRTKNKQKVEISALQVEGTSEVWTVDLPFTSAKEGNLVVGNPATINVNLADALRVSIISNKVVGTQIFQKNEDATNTTGTLFSTGTPKFFGGAFEYYAKKTGYEVVDTEKLLQPAADYVTASETDIADKYFSSTLEDIVLADFSDVAVTPDSDGYYVVDLTVNIWFEGYDNEAFDAVLNQLVSILFKFSLNA